MDPAFAYGHPVRTRRAIRNDGSFPGRRRGEALVASGELGIVQQVGAFLQERTVYTVHFPRMDLHVGCLESELVGREEEASFSPGQSVRCNQILAVKGETVVRAGEIVAIREVRIVPGETGIYYLIGLQERHFLTPEETLEPI